MALCQLLVVSMIWLAAGLVPNDVFVSFTISTYWTCPHKFRCKRCLQVFQWRCLPEKLGQSFTIGPTDFLLPPAFGPHSSTNRLRPCPSSATNTPKFASLSASIDFKRVTSLSLIHLWVDLFGTDYYNHHPFPISSWISFPKQGPNQSIFLPWLLEFFGARRSVSCASSHHHF
jgi:hypothetical protein